MSLVVSEKQQQINIFAESLASFIASLVVPTDTKGNQNVACFQRMLFSSFDQDQEKMLHPNGSIKKAKCFNS